MALEQSTTVITPNPPPPHPPQDRTPEEHQEYQQRMQQKQSQSPSSSLDSNTVGEQRQAAGNLANSSLAGLKSPGLLGMKTPSPAAGVPAKPVRTSPGPQVSPSRSPTSLALHASLPPKPVPSPAVVVKDTQASPHMQSISSDSIVKQKSIKSAQGNEEGQGGDAPAHADAPSQPPKSIPIIRREPLSFFPPSRTPPKPATSLPPPPVGSASLGATAAAYVASTLPPAPRGLAGDTFSSPPPPRPLLGSQASIHAPRHGSSLPPPPLTMTGPPAPPFVFGGQMAASPPFTSPIPSAPQMPSMLSQSQPQMITVQQQAALSTAMQLASFGVGFGPGINPDSGPGGGGGGGGGGMGPGPGNRSAGPSNNPPIINTGNLGPMCVQPGDWVCSVCSFVNWRRRKVCMRCYPFAEGNEVAASLASGAALAAQLAAGIPADPSQIDQLARPSARSRGNMAASNSDSGGRMDPLSLASSPPAPASAAMRFANSSGSGAAGSYPSFSTSFSSASGLDQRGCPQLDGMLGSPRSNDLASPPPFSAAVSPPSTSGTSAIEMAREAMPRRTATRPDAIGTPGLDSLLSTAMRISENKSGAPRSMVNSPSSHSLNSGQGLVRNLSSSSLLSPPTIAPIGRGGAIGEGAGRSLPPSPYGSSMGSTGSYSNYVSARNSPPMKSSPFSSPRPLSGSISHLRDRPDFGSSPPTVLPSSSSTTTLLSPGSSSLSPPTSHNASTSTLSSALTHTPLSSVSPGSGLALTPSSRDSFCSPPARADSASSGYFSAKAAYPPMGRFGTAGTSPGQQMGSSVPEGRVSGDYPSSAAPIGTVRRDRGALGSNNLSDGMLGLTLGGGSGSGGGSAHSLANGSPIPSARPGLSRSSSSSLAPPPPPRARATTSTSVPLPPPPSAGSASINDIWLDGSEGVTTAATTSMRSRTLPAPAPIPEHGVGMGQARSYSSSAVTFGSLGSSVGSLGTTRLGGVGEAEKDKPAPRHRVFHGVLPEQGQQQLQPVDGQAAQGDDEDSLASPRDVGRPRPDPIGTRSSPTKRSS